MAKPNPDPIQQQLIAARRNQILDAATRVFADKGFARATIRDVATTAGIADGTIYNYFENKTALLLGLLNRLNESDLRQGHFAQSAELDIADFVQGYVQHRLEQFGPNELQLLQVVLSEVLINRELRDLYYQQVLAPTFALAEQYFEQWSMEGKIVSANPRMAPRMFAGMVLGVLILRLMGDRYLEIHWGDVPQALAAQALSGLMPPEGDYDATDDQA